MLLISFFYILSAIIYVVTGISVFKTDTINKQNRVFLVLCISLSAWACFLSLMNLSSVVETAVIFRTLATILRIISLGIFMYFVILFVNNEKLLYYKWRLVLVILPILLTLFLFLSFPISKSTLLWTSFGWVLSVPHTHGKELFWFVYYHAFLIAYTLMTLMLLRRWSKKSSAKRDKRQANIVFSTTFIGLALAIISDIVLQVSGVLPLPPLTILFIQIPVLGIMVSIKKYRITKTQL